MSFVLVMVCVVLLVILVMCMRFGLLWVFIFFVVSVSMGLNSVCLGLWILNCVVCMLIVSLLVFVLR